jgi:dGTPase
MSTRPVYVNNIEFAPYAINFHNSRGRIYREEHLPAEKRNEFHRDLDRIIQTQAFQRLRSKTQVIYSLEGGHSTNRLTHSLTVAHIAQSFAAYLGLNTFAVLAIALGHDLGHTPFGHSGERALNDILKDHNMPGFKHNYQSLLTVNKLAKRFDNNCGLNLLYETRDGILKHTCKGNMINVGYYDSEISGSAEHPITLEGQIVGISDEIAQRIHDTADGLRTDRIKINELIKENIIQNSLKYDKLNIAGSLQDFNGNDEIIISKIIETLADYYFYKTLETACRNLEKHHIKTYDDVVKQNISIIAWDKNFFEDDETYQKNLLMPKFYQHIDIQRMDSRATDILTVLFKSYKKQPALLPQPVFKKFVEAVHDHVQRELQTAIKEYKRDLGRFSICGIKRCAETCSYIPNSGHNTNGQIICPLNEHKKAGCEGIRVIINHLAGMTDSDAHFEYFRLC